MKRSRGSSRKSGDDNNVNFRLEEDELLELLQRADRLGLSRHMLGREYVRQMLTMRHDHSNVTAMMEAFGDAIIELRSDVALGVEALLIASGHYTEEAARQWVQTQLKTSQPNDNHPKDPQRWRSRLLL